MKKFLALAALIAVGSANAEELRFGDLNYFIKKGQFNVGADFLSNNETARTAGGDDTEIDSYLLNTHYGYALADNLNVFVGLNFLVDGESEDSRTVAGKTKTDASVDSRGLQNPLLGVNYRLLQQDSAGFNLDFGAVAQVKLSQREVATTTGKDGNSMDPFISNYANPRNNFEFNARLGKKWNEANEWYVLAGAIYNADGDIKYLQQGTTDVDSSVDFKLGAFYQYRPVHEFMMTVGALGKRFGETDGKSGGSDFTISDHIDYQFIFNAKYLVTESVIAKFMFTKDNRENYTVEQGGTKTKLDQRNGLQYGLGVDWIF